MIAPLSLVITTLETKSGKDWTPEEREACRNWLISEKWGDLQRVVRRIIPQSPADHCAGVEASFLNGKLESVLASYKPGHHGILPYVRICLRRHCREAARRLNLEQRLTRAGTLYEEEPTFEDNRAVSDDTPPDWLLDDKELHDLMQREFARLKSSYRDPLLRRLRGGSYEEIANELELTVNVVKIRIFRGRQKLRKALRTAWPGAGF